MRNKWIKRIMGLVDVASEIEFIGDEGAGSPFFIIVIFHLQFLINQNILPKFVKYLGKAQRKKKGE